ncbi:MAG TPA: alpha/beta hydrolase [Patescibacteria group bacterium]|nr:alpha/beta hydrolase [Patescibacteria group bacterium]
MNERARVGSPKQEIKIPEANALERLNFLFYRFGHITRASTLPHQERSVSRPLWLRSKRAELYHQTQGSDTNKRKRIFAEARERDEIAAQYLMQGVITITLPGLGEQTARYTMIEPPEGRKNLEQGSKPPIFLIPGVSNDIDCVGALTQELPYQGRSVVVVGFPESFLGHTTKGFADAVDASQDFGPHVNFYKQAITSLMGDQGDIELWGFSTGAPIAAQILHDPKFQERVTDAVFLSPASTVNQTSMQLNRGAIHELGHLVKEFGLLPKYTFSTGVNDNMPPMTDDHKKLRKRIMGTLIKKVGTVSEYYTDARVKDGGKITIVSGEKDEITKSYRATNMLSQNPQTTVISLPDGHHATPLTQPERVIPIVFKRQRSAS